MPVRMVKTEDLLGESQIPTGKVSRAVIVTTPKGDEIVNFCSPVYGLLKNEDLFIPFEKALNDSDIPFSATYRHHDYAKFYVDYEIKTDSIQVGDAKDRVKPLVRIMHSYNGEIRYRAAFGFYRMICSNGLWGFSSTGSIAMRHTDGNVNIMFDKTIEGINEFILQSEQNVGKYRMLSENKVRNIAERVEDVVENVPICPKRQKESVIARASSEKMQHNLPQTDWLIYNAFNYQLNHNDDITAPEEHKMKIDNKVFQYLAENN